MKIYSDLLQNIHEFLLNVVDRISIERPDLQTNYTVSEDELLDVLENNGNSIPMGYNGFRLSAFVRFINSESANVTFHTFNASLVDYVKTLNGTIKVTGGRGSYTESYIEPEGDNQSSIITEKQNEAKRLAEITITAINEGKNKDSIKKDVRFHNYLITKKIEGKTLDIAVDDFRITGNINALIVPQYDLIDTLEADLPLKDAVLVGYQRISSNNEKRTLAGSMSGEAFCGNVDAKRMVVCEGVVNAIVAKLAIDDPDTVVVSVGSATKFGRLAKALKNYTGQIKEVIIIPDNDPLPDQNVGIDAAKVLAERLVKTKKYKVSIFTDYIGRNTSTSPTKKCDLWDLFASVDEAEFISAVNIKQTCSTLNSLKAQSSELYLNKNNVSFLDNMPKTVLKICESLIEKYAGTYQYWDRLPELNELIKHKRVGDKDTALAVLFYSLGYDYDRFRTIVSTTKVALGYVSVKNGIPNLDTGDLVSNSDSNNNLYVAPMGSGKTENFLRKEVNLSGKECVQITSGVALSKQLVKHFEQQKFVNYQQSTDTSKRVVSTIDSSYKFIDKNTSVHIDEVHQVIKTLNSDSRCRFNRSDIVKKLRHVAQGNQRFSGISADIDDSTYTYLTNLFKVSNFNVAIYGYRVADNANKNVTTTKYKSRTDYLYKLQKSLNEGKKVICVADSLKENKRMEALAASQNIEYYTINSQNKDGNLSNLPEIDRTKQMIILSSSASTGVSFLEKREVFAYRSGTIPIEEMAQLLNRARNRSLVHIFDKQQNVDHNRAVKLEQEERESLLQANTTRLTGELLSLLQAKYDFESSFHPSFDQHLTSLGYKFTLYDSVEAGDFSTSERKQEGRIINSNIEDFKARLQEKTLESAVVLTGDKCESQLESILDSKNSTDKEKMAVTLALTDSLSIEGIELYDDKFHDKAEQYMALEVDTDNVLLRALQEQQKGSQLLCEVDYGTISNILRTVKDNNNISDVIPLVTSYIDKDFIQFHGQVLVPLGIKVPFLRGALKYEKKDLLIYKLISDLVKSFGYAVNNDNGSYGEINKTRSKILKKVYNRKYRRIADDNKIPEAIYIDDALIPEDTDTEKAIIEQFDTF